jgi:uncharacterized protein DUF4159
VRVGKNAAFWGGLLTLAGGLVWSVTAAQAPDVQPREPSLSGLEWTFVRIEYPAWPQKTAEYVSLYGSEPWAIDWPVGERNLSRRVATATALDVGEPVVLPLEDSRLWDHPWIYFVEPGTMNLTDTEVEILREFLLRGGTATFDDFHGPLEWANFEAQMHRVFPDRRIVDVPADHTIFNCFYRIDRYPQVAGLGSFLSGRSWEKGGFLAHLRAISDDRGRAMVLINWNTDMGDGWEWSNAESYPGYLKFTREAYRMMINEVVYSLTR